MGLIWAWRAVPGGRPQRSGWPRRLQQTRAGRAPEARPRVPEIRRNVDAGEHENRHSTPPVLQPVAGTRGSRNGHRSSGFVEIKRRAFLYLLNLYDARAQERAIHAGSVASDLPGESTCTL